MDFTPLLVAAKPGAKPNTIKTYNTVLKTIYKKIWGETDAPDIENFRNTEAVFRHTRDDPIQTRKTKLSAIMALTPMTVYREKIFEDSQQHKKLTEASIMTQKLEVAEITPEEMASVVARVKTNAEATYKKTELTMRDLQDIQNYIIVSLYHGHIPPRRAIDFTEMVLRPEDPELENYIDMRKSKFVFNRYKTAGTYGTQEIAIPPELKKIIKRWIKLIPDDVEYLLFNSKREPLTAVTLNQRLNEIFGPTKGVNSLRHFYLTQHHADTIRGEDRLANEMTAMGSNIGNARAYIKVNPRNDLEASV
jgi:hypothetical protein